MQVLLGKSLHANIYIYFYTYTEMPVKLRIPGWRCLLVTGRAPHAGRPTHELLQLRERVTKAICPFVHDYLVFFLGDTNGHLGEQTSTAVGGHGAVMENHPGRLFHDWLLEHDLWLPSTLAASQLGDQNTTFLAPDGHHESRIDYIAVPLALNSRKIHT